MNVLENVNGIMMDAHQQIKNLYRSKCAALRKGDIESLSVYFAADAIQFPPDRAPLLGWTAIRASLEREFEGIVFEPVLMVKEVVICGDHAYAWGNYRAEVALPGKESTAISSGSFLDIFRRQSDGSWKIARSAWSNHALVAEK